MRVRSARRLDRRSRTPLVTCRAAIRLCALSELYALRHLADRAHNLSTFPISPHSGKYSGYIGGLESPALPLSYSAVDVKNIERHQERQTESLERMTFDRTIAAQLLDIPKIDVIVVTSMTWM